MQVRYREQPARHDRDGGDAQCRAHGALLGFIAYTYRIHGWTSSADLLEATSNETGALRDQALMDAVPRRPHHTQVQRTSAWSHPAHRTVQ
jgi:hypothetical protein